MRLIGFALLSALFLAGCGVTWDLPGPKLAGANPLRTDPNGDAHCFVMERGQRECDAR